MLELHRYRHVDWSPSPVVALAPSVDGSVVAVGRGNGSIEIWIVSAGSVGWHCELTIPGKTDSCLSCLLWCPSNASKWGRLFSAGLDGFISEWDLSTIRPKDILKSYGGSVWQMAIEPHNPFTVPVQAINGRPGDASASASEDESDSDEDDKSERDAEDDIEYGRRVAVACDDGCVRLFVVKDGESMSYKKTFPHVEGRILSLAWSADAEKIFSGGSDGCIRCWDARLSRELYRITAGQGGGKNSSSLCIWSLLVLRDGTLVSGDSFGSTQFWDSKQGTHLQALTAHKADVLALAASPSQQSVFAAGADGQVVQYQHIPESQRLGKDIECSKAKVGVRLGERWVYLGNKRTHSHDVNALVVASSRVIENKVNSTGDVKSSRVDLKKVKDAWVNPNLLSLGQMEIPMLVSGGNDAKLFTYPANAFLAFHPHDVCHAPQRTPIALASNQHGLIMMAQQEHHLEIWRITGCDANPVDFEDMPLHLLGKRKGRYHYDAKAKRIANAETNGVKKSANEGVSKGTDCGLNGKKRAASLEKASAAPPELLATIKCKSAENICCSALSECGQLVAFSDQSKPRLFQLEDQSKVGMTEWRITKRRLPNNIPSAHCMVFCSSSVLILACSDLALWVVDANKSTVIHRIEIEMKKKEHHTGISPVTSLCTSHDSQWLAASNSKGIITVFDLGKFRQHWHVPPLDGGPVTAVAFHPGSSELLVVATSDNVLHVLDVEAKRLGEWSRQHGSNLPQSFLEFPGGIQGLTFCSSRKTTTVVAYSSKAMCFVDFAKPVLHSGMASGEKHRFPNGTSILGKLPDNIDSGKESALVNGACDDATSGQKSVLVNGTSFSKTLHDNHSGDKTGVSNGSGISGMLADDDDSGNKSVSSNGITCSGNLKNQHSNGANRNFVFVSFKDPVLFVGYVSEKSIVIVERTWLEAVSKLPPPVYRHEFGK